jgi:DNA-binding transcriptional LysR family regulator
VRLTVAGSRLLPEARAVLIAADRARLAVAAPADATATRTLRLGSSTGLGDRLARVLQTLRATQPDTEALLVSAPTRTRLERVASGQLGATSRTASWAMGSGRSIVIEDGRSEAPQEEKVIGRLSRSGEHEWCGEAAIGEQPASEHGCRG